VGVPVLVAGCGSWHGGLPFGVSEGQRCRMPRHRVSGQVGCVLPRACVGALRIGENTDLHWLREVQGGEFGRGGDVDGMPRLGDDVGPGSDLRLKVAQDVALPAR